MSAREKGERFNWGKKDVALEVDFLDDPDKPGAVRDFTPKDGLAIKDRDDIEFGKTGRVPRLDQSIYDKPKGVLGVEDESEFGMDPVEKIVEAEQTAVDRRLVEVLAKEEADKVRVAALRERFRGDFTRFKKEKKEKRLERRGLEEGKLAYLRPDPQVTGGKYIPVKVERFVSMGRKGEKVVVQGIPFTVGDKKRPAYPVPKEWVTGIPIDWFQVDPPKEEDLWKPGDKVTGKVIEADFRREKSSAPVRVKDVMGKTVIIPPRR